MYEASQLQINIANRPYDHIPISMLIDIRLGFSNKLEPIHGGFRWDRDALVREKHRPSNVKAKFQHALHDWANETAVQWQAAKTSIFDYIETFYNRKRIHGSIAYMTSMAFEEQWRRTASRTEGAPTLAMS